MRRIRGNTQEYARIRGKYAVNTREYADEYARIRENTRMNTREYATNTRRIRENMLGGCEQDIDIETLSDSLCFLWSLSTQDAYVRSWESNGGKSITFNRATA